MRKDGNEITAIPKDREETDIQSFIQKTAEGQSYLHASLGVVRTQVSPQAGVPRTQRQEAPSLTSGILVTHVCSGAWVCSVVSPRLLFKQSLGELNCTQMPFKGLAGAWVPDA